MSYNVSKLTSASECNKAISLATERKNNLLFEQTLSGKELTNQEKAVQQSNIKLTTVKTQITGMEAAIATMPEGGEKDNFVGKLRRLNDQKDNLEERLRKGGVATLLDTELDAGLVQAQIAAIDSYIAAITAQKATL